MTLETFFSHASDTHIWTWGLGPSKRIDAAAFLTARERARAAAFSTRELSARWIAARAGLRRVLGFYLEREPREVELELSESGKPFAPHSALSFNLSHCADAAALAVTPLETVGVDLEAIGAVEPGLDEEVLAPKELAALARCSPAQRPRQFFTNWVCKEAYLKAIGTGFSEEHPLPSIELAFAPGAAPVLMRAPGAQTNAWRFHQFTIGASHVGAAAIRAQRASFLQMPHLPTPETLIALPGATLMSLTKDARRTAERVQ